MPRKKKVEDPVIEEPLEVDLIKEELPPPLTEKVECETHGSQPRINFVLDGIILAKYCFSCYALSFEKAGVKNFVGEEVTITEIPTEA